MLNKFNEFFHHSFELQKNIFISFCYSHKQHHLNSFAKYKKKFLKISFMSLNLLYMRENHKKYYEREKFLYLTKETRNKQVKKF